MGGAVGPESQWQDVQAVTGCVHSSSSGSRPYPSQLLACAYQPQQLTCKDSLWPTTTMSTITQSKYTQCATPATLGLRKDWQSRAGGVANKGQLNKQPLHMDTVTSMRSVLHETDKDTVKAMQSKQNKLTGVADIIGCSAAVGQPKDMTCNCRNRQRDATNSKLHCN